MKHLSSGTGPIAPPENHSTGTTRSAIIDHMVRHAFVLAASAAVADAPKAALLIIAAAADGARS
ncbi:hypothetical protein FNH08_43015 [Streptomyces spongiae]|uniref:Uncharacterized protein n=1 Tax=Streptomyces spongiae TaxID=565072 RepID=A0A5N8XWD5_9ACTN|nr:hypothetical protein [Streptomyces spongiae]